jgi:hypothetical protein
MKGRAIGLRASCAAALALGGLVFMPLPAAGDGGPAVPSAVWETSVTTPQSEHSYASFYGARGATLAKIEKGSGELVHTKWMRSRFGLPAVTQTGTAGGLSADGETLVLVQGAIRPNVRETEFARVFTDRLKLERITLDGAFAFDAISPDGRWMYLTEYPDPRDPYDYSVRAYDLDAERFQRAPIVDPSEPDEPMTGIPLGRVMSPDGRWAYTLYSGPKETFVHALDTVGHTAVCVDLPQLEDVRSIYLLGLERSGDGGLVVLNRDKPAALIDTETFEVSAPSAPGSAATDGGGGLPWALAAGAFGLTLAAGVLIVRRRRRGPAAAESDLERLVQVDEGAAPDAEERTREWDRVP